jgi:hypothetical protein
MRLFPDKPLEGFSVRVAVLTVGLLAVMGLVTGCSSQCEAVCGEANACTVAERATDVDCPEFCADAEEFDGRAKEAGFESCAAQFQAHLDCWEQNSAQICSTEFEGCDTASQEWVACMTPYCAQMSADKKSDPNCLSGKPTLVPF